MRRCVPLALAILLMAAMSGCIGSSAGTATEPADSHAIHPGYGEFNAGNVLIGDGEVMMDYYGLAMPPNGTAVLRGVVFAKKYMISTENSSGTTGYYGGKITLKAYIADIPVQYAWSGLEPRLEPVSELKVKIKPETGEVEPGKNLTFKVRIDSSGATPGKTYYLYIVAFGEEGWKGWAVVEVTTKETTVTEEMESG